MVLNLKLNLQLNAFWIRLVVLDPDSEHFKHPQFKRNDRSGERQANIMPASGFHNEGYIR